MLYVEWSLRPEPAGVGDAGRHEIVDDTRAAGRGGSRSSLHDFFFSSRRRHTRLQGDWSSDVCSSDLFRQCRRLNGMVKVLGFGMSAMNSHAIESAALPEVLHYTSPEQLRGETCDHRDRKSVV